MNLRSPPFLAAEKGSSATQDPDQTPLVAALVDQLRQEGAPQGMWLVEIAQARAALQNADSLLRRMTEAIIANATPSG